MAPEGFEGETFKNRLVESTNRTKARVQLFFIPIHIVICCYWLGVVEYMQIECSTLHSIGYLDRTRIKISTGMGPSGPYGVMSRAFVFLNCDVGAERAIIEEIQDITCASQSMALQSLGDGFLQPCCNENLICYLRGC